MICPVVLSEQIFSCLKAEFKSTSVRVNWCFFFWAERTAGERALLPRDHGTDVGYSGLLKWRGQRQEEGQSWDEGSALYFSNMRGHFRRAQGGQRTHVREGSPGHGQPEARPRAQKGSCSSIPASFCHTEYESRVAGLPYFSWEAEDTDSWEMSQFLNMATSFPFESLTKHGGRLNLPRAHQVALLACPRDILMKYFTQIATFLLYSIPVM